MRVGDWLRAAPDRPVLRALGMAPPPSVAAPIGRPGARSPLTFRFTHRDVVHGRSPILTADGVIGPEAPSDVVTVNAGRAGPVQLSDFGSSMGAGRLGQAASDAVIVTVRRLLTCADAVTWPVWPVEHCIRIEVANRFT